MSYLETAGLNLFGSNPLEFGSGGPVIRYNSTTSTLQFQDPITSPEIFLLNTCYDQVIVGSESCKLVPETSPILTTNYSYFMNNSSGNITFYSSFTLPNGYQNGTNLSAYASFYAHVSGETGNNTNFTADGNPVNVNFNLTYTWTQVDDLEPAQGTFNSNISVDKCHLYRNLIGTIPQSGSGSSATEKTFDSVVIFKMTISADRSNWFDATSGLGIGSFIFYFIRNSM